MLDKKLVMTYLARGFGVCLLLYIAALLLVLQGPFMACCPINFGPPAGTSTQAAYRTANAVARDYPLLSAVERPDTAWIKEKH